MKRLLSRLLLPTMACLLAVACTTSSGSGGTNSGIIGNGYGTDAQITNDSGGNQGGSDIAVADVPATTGPAAYVACEKSKCSAQYEACQGDSACAAALTCAAACSSQSCVLQCPPASGAVVTALQACAAQQGCSMTGGSQCGNGQCEAGETTQNCAADCPAGTSCGDGKCQPGENPSTCPADCKVAAACGNGVCEAGESVASCPADCTPKPTACTTYADVQPIFQNSCDGCHGHNFGSTCAVAVGDKAIAGKVASGSMPVGGGLSAGDKATIAAWAAGGLKCTPADCAPGAVCGNGKCEAGETAASCAADCGTSTNPGTNYCDANCGSQAPSKCYCDDQCQNYGDCCMPDGSMPTSANKTCAGSTCGKCNGSTPPPSPCGNGTCDAGETPQNCPADCPAPTNNCGNGKCDAGETNATCPADCPAVAPGSHFCDTAGMCGSANAAPSGCYCDNQCPKYGDCCLADGSMPKKGSPNNSCAGAACADCGGGSATPTCGNGKCDAGETNATCPADCPAASTCGNGKCDAGETNANCPKDCPAASTCGNGKCDAGETNANCPKDCPPANTCGNGKCDAGETNATCPADCPAAKTCTSYTDVQSIFQNNCNGCHGHKFGNSCSAAGNYSTINSYVQGGMMPPGGGLSSADKAKIAAWAAAKDACTAAQCP